ncbi:MULTISPECIES: helix-turn-helix transcriptional regulator [Thalassomonas]|uniref:Autoinducer binding domain-containing protein n=1 Tax=Thalassomonas actiniarum TaxID=485447 RepID=A0AAE9YSL0_9GAMM|nr:MULTISPECIES: LuxR family transcriptional regulator [Thalassomonas]WDD98801.1 autoinducer binding domain-containing protein [Thalassomonas actiniarum]
MKDKNKLIQILDLADTCIRASSDSDAISNILEKTNELIPFEAATLAIDTNADFSLTAKQQIFTQNLSEDWQEIYFQRKFFNQDPILSAVSNTDSAVDWRSAVSQSENVSSDFKNLSEKYVGSDGLSILVKADVGSTLLSFVMPEGSITPEHSQLIEYIAPHVHEVFNRQGENMRRGLWQPNLSARELEVLNWAKEGKSNWDISLILAISERTVKFHFSNIFKKLEVLNRSQAIARAIHYGLISV